MVKFKEADNMRLGWTELLIILVIVVLIFGGKRLGGVGRALGKTIKDFKNEIKDEGAKPDEEDASSMEEEDSSK
jgi:sec-independent protein translocase protein TatA